MEVVLWIGGLIAAFFVITFGLHLYRMKFDSYYRHKAREAEQEYLFNQNVALLRKSSNPKIRELVETIAGKGK